MRAKRLKHGGDPLQICSRRNLLPGIPFSPKPGPGCRYLTMRASFPWSKRAIDPLSSCILITLLVIFLQIAPGFALFAYTTHSTVSLPCSRILLFSFAFTEHEPSKTFGAFFASLCVDCLALTVILNFLAQFYANNIYLRKQQRTSGLFN